MTERERIGACLSISCLSTLLYSSVRTLTSVEESDAALCRAESRISLRHDSISMRWRFRRCTVFFVAHILGISTVQRTALWSEIVYE